MEISHAQLNKSSINLAKDIINLEEGDILKAQADTANRDHWTSKLSSDR